MPTLADVLAALDADYDPTLAEDWDAVGLVCGDPAAEVRRVLFAVDPVAAVVDEAVRTSADLLVTHHPLFLRGVHGVPETSAKGRLLARLIRSGIALHVAHTNADVAAPGVSDALAQLLGLTDVRPLRPLPDTALDKLVTFVPPARVAGLLDALAAAGAGTIGDYRRCAFTGSGTGTFLPGASTSPTIGTPGRIETVAETRVEMVLPRARRAAVVAALLAAHPYEEPAYDVLELAARPGPRGLGRVGRLAEPEPLSAFLARTVAALPATASGLRGLGHPDAPVRTVAVCGGAGDGLLAAARDAGADVFLTADLRHHPASEHAEEGGPALVDAPHWATEWPWLPVAATRLRWALASNPAAAGDAPDPRGGPATVEVAVSAQVTDPWTVHAPSPYAEGDEGAARS